jgi:type II secretory pathway component PulF
MAYLIQFFIPVFKNIYRQQKLTPYYKLFIITLPVPFVDKLITPSFAIIIAAVFFFWAHKQGIDSRAINNLFNTAYSDGKFKYKILK